MARILIADDDGDYVRAFSAGMTALGHDVFHAETGAEAVDRVSTDSFDIVFLDIIMRGGGAISILHEIRKLDTDLPVVVISGRAELFDSPMFKEGFGFAQGRIRKSASLQKIHDLVQSLVR